MSNMFKLWEDKSIKTNNCIHGCKFSCYNGNCWAKRNFDRLRGNPKVKCYPEDKKFTEPTFVSKFLFEDYDPDDMVFIGSMGDISFFRKENWHVIFEQLVKINPETLFLLETKNPAIYKTRMQELGESENLSDFPENLILSTTIETNKNSLYRDYEISKAPSPIQRANAMRQLDWDRKHISVEPILDFHLPSFVSLLRDADPDIVSIGYDNYNCGLPEPGKTKTEKLIEKVREFAFVEEKTIREANHD